MSGLRKATFIGHSRRFKQSRNSPRKRPGGRARGRERRDREPCMDGGVTLARRPPRRISRRIKAPKAAGANSSSSNAGGSEVHVGQFGHEGDVHPQNGGEELVDHYPERSLPAGPPLAFVRPGTTPASRRSRVVTPHGCAHARNRHRHASLSSTRLALGCTGRDEPRPRTSSKLSSDDR